MSQMISDAALCAEGVKVLIEKFGHVGAERFVTLMLRELFDYTQWRSDLF
jgi:hypothetical protein